MSKEERAVRLEAFKWFKDAVPWWDWEEDYAIDPLDCSIEDFVLDIESYFGVNEDSDADHWIGKLKEFA